MDHGIEGIEWTMVLKVLKVLTGPCIEGIEWTMVLEVLTGPWY